MQAGLPNNATILTGQEMLGRIERDDMRGNPDLRNVEGLPLNRAQLAELDHLRYKNGKLNLGKNEEEKEESQRKREEFRSVAQQINMAFDRIAADVNYAFNHSAAYRTAALGLEQSLVANGHAVDMLPGAQKAAEEARAKADEQLKAVEKQTLTGADGKEIILHSSGTFVYKDTGVEVDQKALDQIDWNDPQAAQMKEAQGLKSTADTKSHVSLVRQQQDAELKGMKALEKSEREQALAEKNKGNNHEDKGAITSDIKLKSKFGDAAEGVTTNAPEAPAFQPSMAFKRALTADMNGPAAPSGM